MTSRTVIRDLNDLVFSREFEAFWMVVYCSQHIVSGLALEHWLQYQAAVVATFLKSHVVERNVLVEKNSWIHLKERKGTIEYYQKYAWILKIICERILLYYIYGTLIQFRLSYCSFDLVTCVRSTCAPLLECWQVLSWDSAAIQPHWTFSGYNCPWRLNHCLT